MVAVQSVASVMSSRLAPDCIALPIRETVGGDRRLDAEVYLSDGYLVRRDIQDSGLRAPHLHSIAHIWQPSRLKGIQVEEEHGEPYLTATQIFDIWPTARKWLAPGRTPNLQERYVQRHWILVTCSGTVGNVAITLSPHERFIVSHDILRVEVDDCGLRGYIYSFLRTRFGLALMRSSHYGNVIKHLETDHLGAVPIPIIDDLVDELGGEMRAVSGMREEAYAKDMEARRAFADELGGFPEPEAETGYSVSATNVFSGRRRLDGYAHNPTALAVRDTVEKGASRVDRLDDVASTVLPSRFARVYGERGVPFWGSEDIFKINPEIRKFLTRATPVDFDEYRVEPGWLMMARSGQIYGMNGSVILATDAHRDILVSEHVMRIIPRREEIRPGYLQAVLSHPELGQPLVLSRAYGTSIPELAPVDIADLPIARLPAAAENSIADAVEAAGALRMEADERENRAISKLERELEDELGKPGERHHGPLRIPMDFDDVMKTALQVAPPDGETEEA